MYNSACSKGAPWPIQKEGQRIDMSKKYPECPLVNPYNCREIDNRNVCALVRKDKDCLRELRKSAKNPKK
jgi:hypothetical protein